MQTFLPYGDFAASARVLDRQRLGKQRVETMQILKTLLVGGGWRNHPAVSMWRGFEGALAAYGAVVCDEWTDRGYRDGCREKMLTLASPGGPLPPWLGDEAFHASHRSNLLRKLPDWYGRFGWSESPDLSYVWPMGAKK